MTRAQSTVVPIFADVELTDRDLDTFEFGYELAEETGQVDATSMDADDHDGLSTTMALEGNYVDSHGQTEIGFAIALLLGFDLLPRIKQINKPSSTSPTAATPTPTPSSNRR